MENNHASHNDEAPYFPSGYTEERHPSATLEEEYLEIGRAHQGPIPSPEDLLYYSQVLPDAPDRILRMAEQNAQSYRDLNKQSLDAQAEAARNRHTEVIRGQLFGLIAVLSMAAVALVALAMGHPVVAGSICSTTIVGVAAVFVTGRLIVSREKDEKNDEGEG